MSIIDATSGTAYATVAQAITGSAAGDVIQLSAGSYVEDLPVITHSLTIEGVGGLASLSTPSPVPANGRAILFVGANENASLTVSHLELSGARDPASNGAGILFEIGNAALRVTDSWVHGNQDGILTGGVTAASTGGMTVAITRTEIDHNGLAQGDPRYGLSHNVYVGSVTSLLVQDSLIHDALGGHEVKSRAESTTITGNRIQDGPTANTSYSVDLPDGGVGLVSGNLIEKGQNAANSSSIHFGGEGTIPPGSSLTITGNTFIGDRIGGTNAVLNQSAFSDGSGGPVSVTDNTFFGISPAATVINQTAGPATLARNIYGPLSAAPALDASPPYTIQAAAVPEPGTAALLPLALLAAVVSKFITSSRESS